MAAFGLYGAIDGVHPYRQISTPNPIFGDYLIKEKPMFYHQIDLTSRFLFGGMVFFCISVLIPIGLGNLALKQFTLERMNTGLINVEDNGCVIEEL